MKRYYANDAILWNTIQNQWIHRHNTSSRGYVGVNRSFANAKELHE